MPRVVPSDVVVLIDRMFRWASQPVRPGQSPPQLGAQHTSAVAAVMDAVEHVPDALLALSGASYTSLIAGLAACRAAVRAWGAGDRVTYLSAVPGFGDQHAVQLIRQALADCPDQFPSPTTTELTFIPEADLRASIRLDISAANQDLAEGKWKGATVLAGSAIEALLLWALQEREKSKPGEVCTAVGALVGQTLHRDPGSDLEGQGWHLHEYLKVAAHLKIITDDTAALVRLAKDFRNLIHPGRAARLGQKCDRSTALAALAAVEAVARDLTPP